MAGYISIVLKSDVSCATAGKPISAAELARKRRLLKEFSKNRDTASLQFLKVYKS